MSDDLEVVHPAPEDEEGGPVKPFLEHLEDLRWVLIKCLAALGIAMAGCLAAAPKAVGFLSRPLEVSGAKVVLNFMGPLGGVVASMKIALWGGLIIAMPFVLYFIAQFVMPALKRHEKKYFGIAFIVGGGLFLAGVVLCYLMVLPLSLNGMAQYNQWLGLPPDIWRAEEYFQFVTMLMLAMGTSFELPVIILTLVKIGIIQHEWLVKGRRYFFIINLVLCAVITPDFLSTFFLVLPTQVLLEVCIWISAYWERKKQREEARNLQMTEADSITPAD